MTERALALLPDYVLGLLGEAETREVEKALAASPDLVAEMRAISDAYESLATSLAPVAPSAEARLRLVEAIGTADRFLPFLDDLAKMFDLAADKVRTLLRLLDDIGSWEEGPLPGIRLVHFEGGPNAYAADTGFVRLPPGLHFPYHTHDGPEVSYILSGAIRDDDGTVYGPGEMVVKGREDAHEYWVLEDECLIGIALAGFQIVPKPDPR
jgi:putative transcriptional regulator